MSPLTVTEAAELLRISRALCYALVASRKIRHLRIGLRRGKILIPLDAIEEYRESQTVQAAGPKPPKPDRPERFTFLPPT